MEELNLKESYDVTFTEDEIKQIGKIVYAPYLKMQAGKILLSILLGVGILLLCLFYQLTDFWFIPYLLGTYLGVILTGIAYSYVLCKTGFVATKKQLDAKFHYEISKDCIEVVSESDNGDTVRTTIRDLEGINFLENGDWIVFAKQAPFAIRKSMITENSLLYDLRNNAAQKKTKEARTVNLWSSLLYMASAVAIIAPILLLEHLGFDAIIPIALTAIPHAANIVWGLIQRKKGRKTRNIFVGLLGLIATAVTEVIIVSTLIPVMI